jgi:hypothetical protein
MSTRKIQLALVLALVFIFNFLFWNEKMGLNCLVFTPIYLGALWFSFPESRYTRGFQITAIGTLLCAIMITWHNSGAAKLAFFISGMCAAGFAQSSNLKYVLNAFLQYLNSMAFMIAPFFRSMGKESDVKVERTTRRKFRLGFLPLLVIVFFYGLYYLSNEKFAALSDGFWSQLGRLFQWDISLSHIFFVIFALLICGGAIWKYNANIIEQTPDDLQHIRPKRNDTTLSHGMLDLVKEYTQSQSLLWILNGMLFLVNCTDIWYVWFDFGDEARQDLKSYVHEGTYSLIFSIVVAIFVLFYVFRKNLNFYPDNQYLKLAATIWLAQNAVLALSVGIRNWRYIDIHGLAYKRIGVFLFLLLVFFGIYTLWQKIGQRKTMHWLWKRSGWAFYGLLVLNACISWDTFITRYNLSGRPKGTIDIHYLIHTVSDKNLYILEENKERLPNISAYPAMGAAEIEDQISDKRRKFTETQSMITGKSWNGADDRNRR